MHRWVFIGGRRLYAPNLWEIILSPSLVPLCKSVFNCFKCQVSCFQPSSLPTVLQWKDSLFRIVFARPAQRFSFSDRDLQSCPTCEDIPQTVCGSEDLLSLKSTLRYNQSVRVGPWVEAMLCRYVNAGLRVSAQRSATWIFKTLLSLAYHKLHLTETNSFLIFFSPFLQCTSRSSATYKAWALILLKSDLLFRVLKSTRFSSLLFHWCLFTVPVSSQCFSI